MSSEIRTEKFKIDYTESDIDTPVLWESHCHARFEMIAVLEGDVSVMIEGKTYRIKEHQATVIPPLRYHTVTANKHGRYRRVTAMFDAAAIPEEISAHICDRSEIAVFFPSPIERLKSLCQQSESALYVPLADALMIECLYGYMESSRSYTDVESDDFLQKAIAYIDRHLCEKILLDDLARYTSRSKSSFSHLFEEKMHISPKQYVLQKKLALAHKLIRDGTPPTTAALRLGYENYSNFYRLYQKQYGVSPTKKKVVPKT